MIWLSVQDQQRLKNNDGMKWHATQTAKGMLPLSQGHMAENVEVKNQLSIYIYSYVNQWKRPCHLSFATCHLSPATSLQPWLARLFSWRWAQGKSTIGADRAVIAWLVFSIVAFHWLLSTDTFWLSVPASLLSTVTFHLIRWGLGRDIMGDVLNNKFGGYVYNSILARLGIVLHISAFIVTDCSSEFHWSLIPLRFAGLQGTTRRRRWGGVATFCLDHEVKIILFWIWLTHFVWHEIHFIIQTILTICASSRHLNWAERDCAVCALRGGMRKAHQVQVRGGMGGLPPDMPLCPHGS